MMITNIIIIVLHSLITSCSYSLEEVSSFHFLYQSSYSFAEIIIRSVIVTRGEEEIEGDIEGRLVLHGMMEEREGDYSCQVKIIIHIIIPIKAIIITITTMMEEREGDYSCQVLDNFHQNHHYHHQSHHHHHYDGGEGGRLLSSGEDPIFLTTTTTIIIIITITILTTNITTVNSTIATNW